MSRIGRPQPGGPGRAMQAAPSRPSSQLASQNRTPPPPRPSQMPCALPPIKDLGRPTSSGPRPGTQDSTLNRCGSAYED
eukprot:8115984-Alexandrium_andersonii.AAC.1